MGKRHGQGFRGELHIPTPVGPVVVVVDTKKNTKANKPVTVKRPATKK
jgi:hypothetical protein